MSGANHIFQVQLNAALRTSLLNKAMFFQPTCSILPFLVRISSNNHFTDMVLGERIIYCVNYTKTQVTLKNVEKCVDLQRVHFSLTGSPTAKIGSRNE